MITRNALSVLDAPREEWFSNIVGHVNSDDVEARAMVDVETPFHAHKNSDEFFLVLNGAVSIDIEGETVRLKSGNTVTVPAGRQHRARAHERDGLAAIIRKPDESGQETR